MSGNATIRPSDRHLQTRRLQGTGTLTGWPTTRELMRRASGPNPEGGHFCGYAWRLQLSFSPPTDNPVKYALHGTFPQR